MKDQLTPAGTTPQILAPYYASKPLVQHLTSGRQGHVVGMDKYGVQVFMPDTMQDSAWYWESCLPVLRGFSTLTEPLEDGTIPAVEVAKLLLNDWTKEYSYQIVGSKSATGQNFTVHVFKWKPAIGEVLAFRLSFLLDWNWLLRVKWEETIHHLENIVQAVGYLRRHHFAVSLSESQYIPKASASVPTTEGEAR